MTHLTLGGKISDTLDSLQDLIEIANELYAENSRFRETLALIAAPIRSDGTWNRDRKACQELARTALGK